MIVTHDSESVHKLHHRLINHLSTNKKHMLTHIPPERELAY